METKQDKNEPTKKKSGPTLEMYKKFTSKNLSNQALCYLTIYRNTKKNQLHDTTVMTITEKTSKTSVTPATTISL